MTGEQMEFPNTWEEYEEQYGFNDSEEVYTNGVRLIPSFRVKQWLDHLEQEPYEDCISRREAIKKFTYNHKGERIPDYDCDNFPVQIAMKTVKEILRGLPPINVQPKVGQ